MMCTTIAGIFEVSASVAEHRSIAAATRRCIQRLWHSLPPDPIVYTAQVKRWPLFKVRKCPDGGIDESPNGEGIRTRKVQ